MTLTGTNSYVVAAPDAAAVIVVDPGPLLPDHLAALAAAGPVAAILLTHHHGDHSDGARHLHELTGAPVRAARADLCHGGPVLRDGERLLLAGVTLTVLATPGHTSDSLCFLADDAAHQPVLLTGDTILGSGTTVLCHPDGRLDHYLDSLDRVQAAEAAAPGPLPALPGHGPALPSVATIAIDYRTHRLARLAQVRAAVAEVRRVTGAPPSAAEVCDVVYQDLDSVLRAPALLSIEAQLEYLRSHPKEPVPAAAPRG